MNLSFQSKKLEKLLSTEKKVLITYGPDNGRRLLRKMTQLAAVNNLEELSKLPATRLHPHKGKNKELLSLDLKHPFRLLIKPDHDEPPVKEDGGLDWTRVTKVKIIEITDPH